MDNISLKIVAIGFWIVPILGTREYLRHGTLHLKVSYIEGPAAMTLLCIFYLFAFLFIYLGLKKKRN